MAHFSLLSQFSQFSSFKADYNKRVERKDFLVNTEVPTDYKPVEDNEVKETQTVQQAGFSKTEYST